MQQYTLTPVKNQSFFVGFLFLMAAVICFRTGYLFFRHKEKGAYVKLSIGSFLGTIGGGPIFFISSNPINGYVFISPLKCLLYSIVYCVAGMIPLVFVFYEIVLI